MSATLFDPSQFGLTAQPWAEEERAELAATPLDPTNLLLGLAYLGEASTDHVRRLWRPWTTTPLPTNRLLHALVIEHLVVMRRWYRPHPTRVNAPPIPRPSLWSLTPKALALLQEHESFPPDYRPPRGRALMTHDAMTTDIIVTMIERARPVGLSGVYVGREVQLNPPQRKPMMDALIVLRTQGVRMRGDLVPWTAEPRMEGEKRRRYALENDMGTEPMSEMVGKCLAYQRADTEGWRSRYGPFPRPVLVLPTEQRMSNVMNAWISNWPQGSWLCTTHGLLRDDRWFDYHQGQMKERPLFERD